MPNGPDNQNQLPQICQNLAGRVSKEEHRCSVSCAKAVASQWREAYFFLNKSNGLNAGAEFVAGELVLADF